MISSFNKTKAKKYKIKETVYIIIFPKAIIITITEINTITLI
jgi:hypothetical protein